jgi:ADP-heptose:LPS heptosyltransferase
MNLVLQNDWGIGDELLLSAVAREIVRAFPGHGAWIRSRHGFRFPAYVRRDPVPADAKVVDTVYQNPTLYSPRCHSPFPGHLVQQMLDKVACDTGIRVLAADVRPELDLPAMERSPRTVILHTRPNPRLSSKDWGTERWRALAALLREQDVQLLQVGGKDEPAIETAEDLRGLPVAELPEVFARATSVVCVVGLLMHLAEATLTPAVVIYGGRETPAIDGYPDQIHLSSGPLSCRGRWGCHLGPDLECPHGMTCMELITPELVARDVLSTLDSRICL